MLRFFKSLYFKRGFCLSIIWKEIYRDLEMKVDIF